MTTSPTPSGPYAWWMSLPATTREPIKSAVVATALTLNTALCVIYGTYIADPHADGTLHTFLAYLSTHWFGALLGVIVSSLYRARQGYTKAQNASSAPST